MTTDTNSADFTWFSPLGKLLPLNEYAARIGKAPSTVRQKCALGHLPGAVKMGRDWLIPENTPYTDHRVKSGAYISSKQTKEETK